MMVVFDKIMLLHSSFDREKVDEDEREIWERGGRGNERPERVAGLYA